MTSDHIGKVYWALRILDAASPGEALDPDQLREEEATADQRVLDDLERLRLHSNAIEDLLKQGRVDEATAPLVMLSIVAGGLEQEFSNLKDDVKALIEKGSSGENEEDGPC